VHAQHQVSIRLCIAWAYALHKYAPSALHGRTPYMAPIYWPSMRLCTRCIGSGYLLDPIFIGCCLGFFSSFNGFFFVHFGEVLDLFYFDQLVTPKGSGIHPA